MLLKNLILNNCIYLLNWIVMTNWFLVLIKLPSEKLDAWTTFTFCLLVAQASRVLILLFTTQSVRLPLVTYPSLCSSCMTYRTPYHSIGRQVLCTQRLPKEKEDFPKGGKHSKHVPLLTYLTWLLPIINN